MGSPREEKELVRLIERPDLLELESQHQVTITKPFYLGIFPVTQEEYEVVTKTNPSGFRRGGKSEENVRGLDTRRFPVERVIWDEAQECCKRLSALPDEKLAGRVYRLPTEAEWEYACRAGTATPFHFGTSCNGMEANCVGDFPYGTIEKGPFLRRTCAVGSYAPNAFGLYDMHGNVFQWCSDRHGVYPNTTVEDPRGPEEGDHRVVRGGSWGTFPSCCRAAHRGRMAPDWRATYFGFRVAFSPD